MARELHPCGTWGAYKRHLRRGEKACEPCKHAARERNRDSQKARVQARENAGFVPDRQAPATGHVSIASLTEEEQEELTLDPVQVAMQDLRQIEAYMAGPDPVLPTQFTNLSRRREELIDRVRALVPDTEEVDAFDELAKRRESRESKTTA